MQAILEDIMVSPSNNTTKNSAQRREPVNQQGLRNERPADADALYVFPDQQITETRLRELLADGSREERAQAITNLLSFVPWIDIWAQVSPEEVREIFPHLELPPGLRKAWASLLKLPEG